LTKTLAITAIVFVAVIMGMSAIAPMIQYADAHGRAIPEKACDALKNIPDPTPELEKLIRAHCEIPPPP